MNNSPRLRHIALALIALAAGCAGASASQDNTVPLPATQPPSTPSDVDAATGVATDAASPSTPTASEPTAGGATSAGAITGAWHASGGPGAGSIAGIVLERGSGSGAQRYFVDRVVQCIRAPCPPMREDGTYTVSGATLALQPGGGGSALRYGFTLQGETLVLRDGPREVATLSRARSYCAQPVDCSRNEIPQPRCMGNWTCNPDATCTYRCGPPAPASGGSGGGSGGSGSSGGTAGGVRCGSATCGAGQVCCNPLRGICTAPGMMCIQ